jgi:hypothetical protein
VDPPIPSSSIWPFFSAIAAFLLFGLAGVREVVGVAAALCLCFTCEGKLGYQTRKRKYCWQFALLENNGNSLSSLSFVVLASEQRSDLDLPRS